MHDLLDLPDSGNLLTFDDVREAVEDRAQRNYPDVVLDMTRTHVTPLLDFDIPGVGILEMTPWSKSQISSHLGVKWDKWFNGIPYDSVQDEIQRRFKFADTKFLVRSCHHDKAKAQNQGQLRAFLSPGYQTIDDRRLVDCMAHSDMRNHLYDDVSFVRWQHRESFTDRSTHLTGIVGEEVVIVDPETGREDKHLHGFLLRNSEVGYSSFTLDDFWFRIICLNGMITMVGNKSLYRRRHVKVDDDSLEEDLNHIWADLMTRRQTVEEKMVHSASDMLEAPLVQMRAFLRKNNVAKYLIQKAEDLYEEEPVPSRFMVSQAITAAARGLESPDARMELEKVGGKFLLAA
jgi:hypothetical protein